MAFFDLFPVMAENFRKMWEEAERRGQERFANKVITLSNQGRKYNHHHSETPHFSTVVNPTVYRDINEHRFQGVVTYKIDRVFIDIKDYYYKKGDEDTIENAILVVDNRTLEDFTIEVHADVTGFDFYPPHFGPTVRLEKGVHTRYFDGNYTNGVINKVFSPVQGTELTKDAEELLDIATVSFSGINTRLKATIHGYEKGRENEVIEDLYQKILNDLISKAKEYQYRCTGVQEDRSLGNVELNETFVHSKCGCPILRVKRNKDTEMWCAMCDSTVGAPEIIPTDNRNFEGSYTFNKEKITKLARRFSEVI